MELRQLYYLSVCAETKSFTRAAAVLYTAQSNVSKVIKSLEEELGFELFERRQYGIALTSAGRQVYEQAQVTLGSARQILEFARTGQREELRICCNPSSWMTETFSAYYREHGREDVHYSVMTGSTGQVIERLAKGIDQIGFVYVLESKLPALQSRLEKEHLFCTMLTKTRAVLYLGAKADPEKAEETALVQGFEDEFTLRSYRNEEEDRKLDRPVHRIAVTTNSEDLQRVLLEETDLGHIGSAPLDAACSQMDSETADNHAANNKPNRKPHIVCGEEPVLFGYISRNDRDPNPLTIQFLSYLRKRLPKAVDA